MKLEEIHRRLDELAELNPTIAAHRGARSSFSREELQALSEIELFEMPPHDLHDAEHEIIKLFRPVDIVVVFTKHFDDRATAGSRGDQIERKDLLGVFEKVKERRDELIRLGREHLPELEGVIKDELTKLNIPFALAFSKRLGKFALTIKTVMRKDKPFHVKPGDVTLAV